MSSYFIKAGPINLAENVLVIVYNKAYKGFNTLLKSTSLYKGLN